MLAFICAVITLALRRSYTVIWLAIAWSLGSIYLDLEPLGIWPLPHTGAPRVIVPGIVYVHVAVTIAAMALYWRRRLRHISMM